MSWNVLCCLLDILSSLIHHQYSKEPSLDVIMDRMLPGVPSMYDRSSVDTCTLISTFSIIHLHLLQCVIRLNLLTYN